MRAKPVVLCFGAIVLLSWFVMNRYDAADEQLQLFYSQIRKADFSGARESIDEAIRLWPTNSRYYGWRAYCISQKLPSQCPGRKNSGLGTLSAADQALAKEAVRDYRRSLELNERDAVAHHNLAWLEHLLGDDKSADGDWQRSIGLDPDNAVFRVSYGMFLEEMGNSTSASEHYSAVMQSTPAIVDSPFFTRYRDRSPEVATGLVAESIAKLQQHDGNDPIVQARLGKLYAYSGDIARASQLLGTAAEKLPNLPLVWYNLGQIHEAEGKIDEALSCYRKAAQLDGSLPGPYLRMGIIELDRGHKQSATRDLMAALQRWQRMNPVTSAHNGRLYLGSPQQIDDLLPTTLVWYIKPCEASLANAKLSELMPGKFNRYDSPCEQLPSPHPGVRETKELDPSSK